MEMDCVDPSASTTPNTRVDMRYCRDTWFKSRDNGPEYWKAHGCSKGETGVMPNLQAPTAGLGPDERYWKFLGCMFRNRFASWALRITDSESSFDLRLGF
jgi:hypothetical protein